MFKKDAIVTTSNIKQMAKKSTLKKSKSSSDRFSPKLASNPTLLSTLEAEELTSAGEDIDTTTSSSKTRGVILLAKENPITKWKNWWIRTLWTFFMIVGFAGILIAGHLWVLLLVIAVQGQIYREVISIAHQPSKEIQFSWFRSMSWYFLFSTNYFLYGESIIHYLKQHVLVDAFLLPLATHHRFISFSLYYIGFVLFVLNLKKGLYRAQFSQFGWTHMTLLLVVFQSHFIINNIFEGLFWFLLPVSLVVINDIFAYIFGSYLSPKRSISYK